MKKQKDLTTLFREGEKQLKLEPSSNTWNRLEERMEAGAPKKSGKIVRMRSLRLISIAASFALVIGAFYLFQQEKEGDLVNDLFKPTFMETLSGAEDCNPYCAVLKARKELLVNTTKTASTT